MSEEYFYKTLGMEFGPVSLAEIRELLSQGVIGLGDRFRIGASPWRDVAEIVQQPETVIRPVQSSEWIAAAQITGLVFPLNGREEATAADLPPAHETPTSQPALNAEMRHLFAECVSRQRSNQAAHPVSHSHTINTGQGSRVAGGITGVFSFVTGMAVSIAEWVFSAVGCLVKSRSAWAVACLLLFVLLIPRISAALMTQSQVLSSLEETFNEWERLQTSNVDESTWKEFQQRASSKLAKLVPQLERNADVNDKGSMSLLWIARDYLPALLNDPKTSADSIESKIKTHIGNFHLAQQQVIQPREAWDLWTMSIVGVDALGVLAAALYFGRKRLSKA